MVNQEKIPAGHKGLAIFHISRTFCGILAVPSNAVFCTCPGLTLYQCSEATYSGLTTYSTTCNQLVQQSQSFYRLYPPSPELEYHSGLLASVLWSHCMLNPTRGNLIHLQHTLALMLIPFICYVHPVHTT